MKETNNIVKIKGITHIHMVCPHCQGEMKIPYDQHRNVRTCGICNKEIPEYVVTFLNKHSAALNEYLETEKMNKTGKYFEFSFVSETIEEVQEND